MLLNVKKFLLKRVKYSYRSAKMGESAHLWSVGEARDVPETVQIITRCDEELW